MALNPAFESQTTRCLPLAYGYVQGSGDKVLSTVTAIGSQTELHLHAEGEWDGCEMLSTYQGAGLKSNLMSDATPTTWITKFANLMHFHAGAYTPKGLGNQMVPVSTGPDQWADLWFPHFPTVTPPQSFSGISYAVYNADLPVPTGGTIISGAGATGLVPFSIAGIWRGSRCRTFDANGNVLTYQFTCNPAWHFVDAILRYKIKPQQPYLAGLTAAEKACFNWPSIVANAARNDFILPNGLPRFIGSYIFASDATLTNILETILRVSRSYQYVRNGQIYLMGDDPRSPSFFLSQNHVVPGSLNLSKKDVSKAANVYVPKYRDLNVPAVCTVVSVGPGASGDPAGTMVFTTSTPSPFFQADVVVYGGSDNAAAHGDYAVFEPSNNDSGLSGVGVSYIVNKVYVDGPATPLTANGGVLGSNNARFSERAPTNVQHRSHQKMVAAQAPGLAVQPKVVPVYYDCGNCTFDQTNRLMKFERDSQLGTDIGPGWMAPIAGTLTVYLEAVDGNGNAFSDVNPHDVIQLDDWVSPEFPGDYVVMDPITINPPTATSVGTIDISLLQYNPNAFTDISDDPGDSYASVPSVKLPLSGFVADPSHCWVLAMPSAYTVSGGTMSIPNLMVQLIGRETPTTYASPTWTGLTVGSPYVLYIDDPVGDGSSYTTGSQAGSLPLAAGSATRYVVFSGIVAAPTFTS